MSRAESYSHSSDWLKSIQTEVALATSSPPGQSSRPGGRPNLCELQMSPGGGAIHQVARCNGAVAHHACPRVHRVDEHCLFPVSGIQKGGGKRPLPSRKTSQGVRSDNSSHHAQVEAPLLLLLLPVNRDKQTRV